MNLSAFGEKFTRKTGILGLMEDIAEAAAEAASGGAATPLRMLGGGNPARIPAVEERWRSRAAELVADPDGFARLIGTYDSADGMVAFRDSLAALLRKEYGWPVTGRNICVTNGSQIAVWYLVNLLAGQGGDGRRRRIFTPLMPEYVGYADQALGDDAFVSLKPLMEKRGDDSFKYRVDLDAAESFFRAEGHTLGAVLASRPTNPTGNVLDDQEVRRIAELARKAGVPFIVDNAYGLPFPAIVFKDATPIWDDNMVLTMSLSKIGLPSTRTGMIIAREEIVSALSATNAIASLATGTFGQAIVAPLIASGEILELSRREVTPFYRRKRELALSTIREEFAGLPVRTHSSEGAIFLWLWFEDLPIDSQELYRRLKAKRVLVIPGEHFSFGNFADGTSCTAWDHPRRCIRVNYSGKDEDVVEGIRLIAAEARAAYGSRSGT